MAFLSEAGDDSSAVQGYQAHVEYWTSTRDIEEGQVKTVFKDIGKWAKTLRSGACDLLLGHVLARTKQVWQDSSTGVNTDLFQELVENLSKYLSDPALKEIRSALLTKSASDARSAALADFTDKVSNYRGDMSLLNELVTVCRTCEKMPKPEQVLTDIHNCKGFICKAFAETFSKVERRNAELTASWAIGSQLVQSLHADLAGTPQGENNKSGDFMDGFAKALDLKTTIVELQLELTDGSTGCPALFSRFYAAKKDWLEFLDSHPGNAYLQQIAGPLSPLIESASTQFREAVGVALRVLLENVGKARPSRQSGRRHK